MIEMKKKLILILKLGISVLLAFLMIKFCDLDITKTFHAIKSTNIFWFIATTVMFTATTFTNAYRWMILVRLLNYELTFGKAVRMYFESAFSNNFLPTNFGGDAIRAYDLGKQGKSWLRAASTVLAERFYGFAMMFCMIPIGLFVMKYTRFANAVPSEVSLALWLTFIATVIGIGSYKLWSKIPLHIVQKMNFAVKEYTRCKKSLQKVILWTLITHLLLLIGNVCSAYALGITVDQIPAWYWLIITPAATLAGFIIPAVKGVGAKEASYIYFLGLLGISSDTSLAIGFIAFIATTISTLPGLSIAFRKIKFNKVIEEEEEHEEEELAKLS
jgi:uncharacterized protein (TIRG00374 family)